MFTNRYKYFLGLVLILFGCNVIKPSTEQQIESSIQLNKSTLWNLYKFKNGVSSNADSTIFFNANTNYKINNHFIDLESLKKLKEKNIEIKESYLDIITLKNIQEAIAVIQQASSLIEDLNYYTILFVHENKVVANMSLEKSDKKWTASEYMNTRMGRDANKLLQLSQFNKVSSAQVNIDCYTASGTSYRFYRVRNNNQSSYFTSLLNNNDEISLVSFESMITGLLKIK